MLYRFDGRLPVTDTGTTFAQCRKENKVLTGAPQAARRLSSAYRDPYGIREAIPAGTYVGQFFEHLGFVIVDEWYILSEFHGSEEFSTVGRMGNIKGLPTQQGLKRIEDQASLAYFALVGKTGTWEPCSPPAHLD